MHNRIWIGRECWANPMEDWCVDDGSLVCTSTDVDRNVHVLSRQLSKKTGTLQMSVRLKVIEKHNSGSAGFSIGIHDDINDWRGNLLWGKGVDAGVGTDGQIFIDKKVKNFAPGTFDDVVLKLAARPSDTKYNIILRAVEPNTKKVLAKIENSLPADNLLGNLALVNNFRQISNNRGSRYSFSKWLIDGTKLAANESHCFGPVLWAMHTLSDSRGADGYVMKMTAQMPPLGKDDNDNIELQIKQKGVWKTLGTEKIHADSRTATFKITEWDASQDIDYRLVYTETDGKGAPNKYYWSGTVRKDPTDKEKVIFAPMTCQYHYGFPYTNVVNNLEAADPDLLYFSGDQIYEANGHYGIIRKPSHRAILNFLRKWYLFGWAFGNLMRDRPVLCTPDDHDVYHGNLWGDGGKVMKNKKSNKDDTSGYIQPVSMVNVVHKVNCSHHPDFYDPTPVDNGISVWYGDMVYGRISFAIVSDRMFKSGPKKVSNWKGRSDHVPPGYDVTKLDNPDLKLLGDRQIKFLQEWIEDWRGADMKILLSQSVFSGIATHHGGSNNYLEADLDSNGWPQSARNRAIRLLRKSFALHVSGDQHLTTLSQYGVDQQRDSCWSLCVPAICVGYQRWWRADEMGFEYKNRPEHGLPDTGEYEDTLNNKIYIYAVGNPWGSRHSNRYTKALIKASGFSIVDIDKRRRTYTCKSYKWSANLSKNEKSGLFPGFGRTISQQENYGRKRFGYLDEVIYEKCARPVLKVYKSDGKLEYAIRLTEKRVRPWVFEDGEYTVKIGDPEKDKWKVLKGMTVTATAKTSESKSP